MRDCGFGPVIVSSSINGQTDHFASANNAATNAGGPGIAKSLALGRATRSIIANAVFPGYMTAVTVVAVPVKTREKINGMLPSGRLGEPNEIARSVMFPASDDAGSVNCSTISADGRQLLV
jgi:acetoacetyl-CoA reductase